MWLLAHLRVESAVLRLLDALLYRLRHLRVVLEEVLEVPGNASPAFPADAFAARGRRDITPVVDFPAE
jgi:hypothetical protein